MNKIYIDFDGVILDTWEVIFEQYYEEFNTIEICFVPYTSSKTQYVDPHNNILIDDDLKNLEEWEEHGGISVFFNKDLNNYDSYGNKNNKFIIINDLLKIYGII